MSQPISRRGVSRVRERPGTVQTPSCGFVSRAYLPRSGRQYPDRLPCLPVYVGGTTYAHVAHADLCKGVLISLGSLAIGIRFYDSQNSSFTLFFMYR
jgi:hypothetical protein